MIVECFFVDYFAAVALGGWVVPWRSVIVITMDRTCRYSSSEIVNIILVIAFQPMIDIALPLQLVKVGFSVDALEMSWELVWKVVGSLFRGKSFRGFSAGNAVS